MTLTNSSPKVEQGIRDQEPTEKTLIKDMLTNKRAEWVSYVYFYSRRPGQDKAISLPSIMYRLTDAEYWALLGHSYRQFKEPMGIEEKEKATWLYLFTAPRTDRHHLMSPKDYAAFIALPDLVQIFRAVHSVQNAALSPAVMERYARGMSWTLSQRKAERFANQFGETNAAVFTATVPKGKILGYFSGRGRAELVIDPRGIKVYRVRAVESGGPVSSA